MSTFDVHESSQLGRQGAPCRPAVRPSWSKSKVGCKWIVRINRSYLQRRSQAYSHRQEAPLADHHGERVARGSLHLSIQNLPGQCTHHHRQEPQRPVRDTFQKIDLHPMHDKQINS